MPERRHLGIRQAEQWRMQICLIRIAFHALGKMLEPNSSLRELDDGALFTKARQRGKQTGSGTLISLLNDSRSDTRRSDSPPPRHLAKRAPQCSWSEPYPHESRV